MVVWLVRWSFWRGFGRCSRFGRFGDFVDCPFGRFVVGSFWSFCCFSRFGCFGRLVLVVWSFVVCSVVVWSFRLLRVLDPFKHVSLFAVRHLHRVALHSMYLVFEFVTLSTWSIRSQENLVYYDLVWIRKTATVVTMSAAFGQKKTVVQPFYFSGIKRRMSNALMSCGI